MGRRNGRRKHTALNESANLNNASFSYYYYRLMDLAISQFEWSNLPDSVDERFLEKTLFLYGNAVYFNDEVLGDLALQCTLSGGFDVYGIPIRRRAYAINGYQRQLDKSNSVLIYNNQLHINTEPVIWHFATRLWDLDRTIDINAKAQKTPILLKGSEQQQISLTQLYEQYDGNKPVIYGDSNMAVDPIQVLKTDAPFVADKIQELRNQIWNEAISFLGISNVAYQKKERMVTDEVMRQMGGTIASRNSRLEARRQAAEAINKMFNEDIEVNFRENSENSELEPWGDYDEPEEGELNE